MKKRREGVQSLAAVLPRLAMVIVLVLGTAATTLAYSDPALPRIVQNDIAIEPGAPASGQRRAVPVPVHVALLLPLRSPILAEAAAAVRDGFMAALHTRLQPVMVVIDVVETTDSVADHLAQLARVELSNHLIIGPLTRDAAAALAPVVTQTTIALAPAGNESLSAAGGVTGSVTNKPVAPLIAMGLSIEEEARQLADWASRSGEPGEAWIISSGALWQQRAAHAFAQQLQARGRRATLVQLDVASGVLDPEHLSALREKSHHNPPAFLFFALDFGQAVQLREALGAALPAYGTSQLNPFNAAQWQQARPVPQLDGVRLLELPGRLDLEGRDAATFDAQILPTAMTADLDRLQALGADAFLVMQHLLLARRHFSMDGQTGRLTFNLDPDSPVRFSRKLTPAIYQDGRVTLWQEE